MKKPYIIGIAGGTASGKSTFCDILEKKLCEQRCKVIHIDDYYKPESERPYVRSPISEKMYIDDNQPNTINLDAVHSELLNSVNSDYDIIIVEGLFSLWDNEIYQQLDLKLFVDCKADERIVRRVKRNMEWGLSFDEITSVYLDMVRFRHDEYVEPTKWKADLIINGSKPSLQATNMLVEYIKKH